MNPFFTQSELISISTASAAPPEVKHDLMNAKEKGEKAYDEFRKARFGEKASIDVYDRQSKLKLKTFSDLRKSKTKQKFPEKTSF